MNSLMKLVLEKFVEKLGYGLISSYNGTFIPDDIEELYRLAIMSVKPYTMTSAERIYGLIKATEYIVENRIEGSFIECGVWRGGSIMAIIQTLIRFQEFTRPIYLFDTFEGMPAPQSVDVFHTGETAKAMFEKNKISEASSNWCYATLEEVKNNILNLGYPENKIHFIKGLVENTIPKYSPQKIALMRLDTDFYLSTKHELDYLYPNLEMGGVIIIDDYGCWSGCRKATDEFLDQEVVKILLNRLDHTGYIGVKVEK